MSDMPDSQSAQRDAGSPKNEISKHVMALLDRDAETSPLTQEEVVDVFVEMHRQADPATWHRIPGLRDFLRRHGNENPYVPSAVRERELLCRQRPWGAPPLVDIWQQKGLPFEVCEIEVSDLVKTIEAEPEIASQFAERNLHDAAYYVSKYLEWHVTILSAQKCDAKSIVDLGAAYDGFARVAKAMLPETRVGLVDLVFPAGRTVRADGIELIGSDAGDLSVIADGEIDIVCSHNAFEHFSGDSDIRSLKEASRILKPGGRVLITPFFTVPAYTVTLQPFSVFTCTSTTDVADAVAKEVENDNVRIRYNHGIISGYARHYDFDVAQERLFSNVPDLEPRIVSYVFKDDGQEHTVFGVKLPPAEKLSNLKIIGLELVRR